MKLLEKCHVPSLLRESLPGNLTNGDFLQGYPVDKWLKCIWEYLGQHFKTNEDLSLMNNLPLVPVDLSKGTLTMLANQSKVVVRCLDDQRLEKNVSSVLENFGVIVVESLPDYLKHHPCVLDTYVHRPSVHGVLKAMAVSASDCLGMLSAVLLDMQAQGRGGDVLSLRKFISKTESLEPREKEIISSLPLFEEAGQPYSFVSKKDVWGAVPQDADDYLVTLPTATKFIDARADDSRRLVTLLEVKPVTMIDFLLHGIFPCVQKGTYCTEDIDKVMNVVIKRYDIHSGNRATLKEKMRNLAFVPTKYARVKPRHIFDPKNELLRRIFAEEDVFPVGEQYNDPTVLAVLQKLGMKSDHEITAQDLLQSTRIISEIPNMISAEVKSEAIMAYLKSNPNKLEEPIGGKKFGDMLRETSWISRIKQTPDMFPKNLPFRGAAEEKPRSYKPSEIYSADFVNLIGSVRPIVKVQSCGEVAKHFGWDEKPQVAVVAEHFKLVIDCYSQNERPLYMMIVEELYSFFVDADYAFLRNTFKEMNIIRWIWNGDGFSTPSEMLAEKPLLDLSPYILSLPPETKQYQPLFAMHGLEIECGDHVLFRVLRLMKKKYDQNNPPMEVNDVNRDLQLSLDILNDLMSRDVELPLGEEKVLIPTFVKGNESVRLAPAESCVYREHEWLQQENDEEEDGYFFVHPLVSNSTAEFFGIRTLGHVMLDPDELGVGEEFGQEEKLTRRLKRLLEEYTDGFAVPKELIQNADDAGATEIKFLYDERQNEDALTCLIDDRMKECQGAALWVYNDAEFRDEDFENLTKLSGATKEHNTEKIGKFGLGFNAVYNLTDVPMLVSRNYFVILDPHTFYLGKAIRNKSKPGMKIDLNKNVKRLRKFRNQFKPFNGIFGCDLELKGERNSYSGTLFRFPLRTKEQAVRSEIKQLHYDSSQVKALLLKFIRGARSLLLFTQNIRKVSILHLPRKGKEPEVIFELTKEVSKHGILKELSAPFRLSPPAENLSEKDQFLLTQCNFLKASSEFAKSVDHCTNRSSALLQSAFTFNAVSTVSKYGRVFFGDKKNLPSGAEKWLVVSSMGTGEAMQFAQQARGLVPAAGVAVQLTLQTISASVPISQYDNSGAVFCYLPLPIRSGLPVHVNGTFAVASNRRSLKEKTEDDKGCAGTEWNNVLLKDTVCAAYLDLIEHLKPAITESRSGYLFHSLWPKDCKVQQALKPLSRSFYENLVHKNIPFFSNGTRWVGVNDVAFLHPTFRDDEQIGNTAFEVLKLLAHDDKAVIDLPSEVLDSFKKYGLSQEIQSGQFDEVKFFRELFFPNISTVPDRLRDILVLYALDDKQNRFDDLIKEYECIPTSPSGKTRKFPWQLISPGREVGQLFLPQDERFPHGTQKTFLDPSRMSKLERFGMLTDSIPWLELAERVESIRVLDNVDIDAARERVKAVINFMERKLKRDHSLPGPDVCIRIQKARFLPFLQKPANFPLTWKGDHLERNSLLSPNEIYPEERKYLVCCTEPVIGMAFPQNVSELLNLHLKSVTVQQVIKQLENAMSVRPESLTRLQFEELECVCKEAYITLQQRLTDHGMDIISPIQGKSFILLGRKFASAKQLAFTLRADCSPYLFKLPTQLSDLFAPLMRAAGVKEKFNADDFKSGLIQLHKRFQGNELDEDALRAAVQLANQLGEALKTSSSEIFSFPLPDSKKVMRPLHDLCIRDCVWIPDEEGVHFVNSKIPWPTCKQVGVKTRQTEALRRHKIGIPFGQKEKLTNRIKRILTGYPCEKEILKEMLQNADDAKATEICFIKDPRHHSEEKVFHDSWKPLQGPALCVYNNRPFTNADIEGIHNLGEGSKEKDPSKTGQYGVGFNAVYHLTDVPSFMTCGEEVGEALVAFDPHCQYVPEASPEEPGAMFKDLSRLKKTFPDVFSCYLEEQFPLNGGTMFRVPLRTEEMSKTSHLSSTPVTLTAVETMMKDLKKELFEVLLFVNNVKKITLCEINKQSGKIENQYSVEAIMSGEDETKRQDFANHIKQVAQLMKREDFNLSDIKARKVSYVLNIADNIGSKERWLIVQQIGFEKEVPGCINSAFSDLGLLPQGGVACLLEKTSNDAYEKCKKAFCFLPLPFETNLPVHINGHFALDHEARRNLWRDEGGGYRSDWNNVLLGDVVTSCYLTLLEEVRAFLQLPSAAQIGPCIVQCSRAEILRRVAAYERLFPLKPIKDPYWKTLVDSLYREVDAMGLKVLPVVRGCQKNARTKPSVEVTWLPCTGERSNQAFFNNLSETEPFRTLSTSDEDNNEIQKGNLFEEILLESGFNLVASSMSLYRSLKRSKVSACTISPISVLNFYKSINSPLCLCKIGNIPCHVNETPFRNPLGVILVLLYCKETDGFLDQLSGVPLLLTQDNRLHLFSSTQPKFLSRFHDLLPGSPQEFLHEEVCRHIFTDPNVSKSPFLRPLNVEGFVVNLPQTISQEYYGNEAIVQWCPSQHRLPNQKWLSRVWLFLGLQTQHILDDNQINEGSKIERVKSSFQPLANWSIIPAFESRTAQRVNYVQSSLSHNAPLLATELLFPLCRALSILDCSSPDATNVKLVTVLKNLGVPELSYVPLVSCSSGTYLQSFSTQVALARLMISSLKTPTSLLTCLDQKIAKDPHSPQRLEPADCKEILDYFSRSVRCLEHSDREMLTKLPFYRTTYGGCIRLEEHGDVKVLPLGIPREEFEFLEKVVHTVFLEFCLSLSDLFDFIGLVSLSVVDVYCTYILPNLNVFSNKAREVHLEYVLKVLLSTDSLTHDEELRLLNALGTTPFIPSADGCLECARFFFDPREDVFRVMLAAKKFPPPPFQSLEWLKLLRKIGLVHKVSQDHFKIFAEEVAKEAKEEQTEKTYEKSKVLVKHLIRREDVVKEGLLTAVCGIPFVACEHVRKELQDLCQPYEAVINSQNSFCAFRGSVPSEYAEIVWTRAHLLPRWAVPSQYSHELGCPQGVKKKHYLEQFIEQLQIMINPTVELVVNHCQTLCFHLERQSERKRNSFSKLKEIMEGNYTFLQDQVRQINSSTKAQLTSTPFILVEEGRRFVAPNQVVLELYEDLEIKPYLYRVPPEFGRFHPLFQFLGCCKNVGMSHYVTVLEEVHKKCKTAKLHPNEVSICVKASKGFFELLDKNKEVENFPKVHLPAVIPREVKDDNLEATPLTLQESSTLIFNDVSSIYYDRLQKFNRYFLLDLHVLKVRCSSSMTNYKDLLLKLPSALQPKMLSCVVREALIDGQSAATAASEAVKSLKQTLSSPQFCFGIIRLIRDVNVENEKFDEGVIGRIESGLFGLDISIASNLRTTLICDDCPIPDSEAKADHFIKTNLTPEGESYTVYVDATSENTLLASVSFAIVELYGGFLGKRAALINQMLHCHPDEIWPLLDRLKIRADNSYRERRATIYPKPGSFIPLEDHHLLNEDFEDFNSGDYVGYELDDPTLNQESGVATYIYARIVEEVTDPNCFLLAKRYKIEIGDNQEMEVDAADLYKFHRSEDFNCTAVDVTDGPSENFSRHYASSSKGEDMQELFEEISDLLEQAWNMPEEKRRKVIKRLYLRWHPDKNVGNEELCNEVFKHLQNEISRLERGEPRDIPQTHPGFTGSTQRTSYDDFFSSWGSRARQHHAQREEYRTRQQSYRSSHGRPNPQPGEARRWFRQARADVTAVMNDVVCNKPSFEWACFKCQQVV